MSRIYFFVLKSLSLLIGIVLSQAIWEPVYASEPAWVFIQFSKLYGKLVVIVSKNNLRFIRSAKGMTIDFDSKGNEVMIYNSSYKSYFKTDLNNFEKLEEARLQMMEGYLSDLPMNHKKTTEKIAGLAVRHFTLSNGNKAVSTGRWDSQKVFSLDSPSIIEANLWTTSGVDLSPTTQKALHILYHLPPEFGVPLRMSLRVKKYACEELELDTASVSKTAFPARFMKPPTGFVKVAEYADVVHQHRRENLNGMMQYFDAFHKMGQ